MASVDPLKVQIELSGELKAALEETQAELKAAREALSEERIRAIVREELAAWEKKQVQARRFGLPAHVETK